MRLPGLEHALSPGTGSPPAVTEFLNEEVGRDTFILAAIITIKLVNLERRLIYTVDDIDVG